MPSTLERTLAIWRRSPPWGRRLASGVAVLLVLWATALALANREASRARLRAAIREAIARKLPGADIGDSISIDPLFRVTFGPLTVRAERRGAQPLLRAERVKVRASVPSLLGGRFAAASVRLYGARLVPGDRLEELRSALDRTAPDSGPPHTAADRASDEARRGTPRDWPTLHLRGATIVLRVDGGERELGPFDAKLTRRRTAEGDDVELSLSLRAGGNGWAAIHRDDGGWGLRASLLGLAPEALPAWLETGAVRWSGGTLSGDLAISGRVGALATGHVRARLDRGWFSGDRLASNPVGPATLDLQGDVEADPRSLRLALRSGSLRALGVVEATLSGDVRLGAGLPFSLTFDAPAVDYGELADALPAALRPPPDAPRPSGPFAFRLALAGPLREPAAWSVDASLDLSALREAARRAPAVPLRAPFTWKPETAESAPPAIRVGPDSPDFVPLGDLPDYVFRAVTTSEDGGFFAHSGFDFEELRNAWAQGREAGRVVRGASTITQQLAKNLYLSREKTLSRKAREAMIAVGLEATVPKARLLEIYLNIAEWGPGIWGIGPAARHYFGKPAPELTLREAAFLASIIPNPIRFHYYYAHGELDEAWTERLRVILQHMAEAGAIGEEQLAEALDAPLAFASRTAAATTPEGRPPAPSLAPAGGPGSDP